MTVGEVGRAGQRADVLHGGDVAPDGRLLSVQEIQQWIRDERDRRGIAAIARPNAKDGPAVGRASGAALVERAGAADDRGPVPVISAPSVATRPRTAPPDTFGRAAATSTRTDHETQEKVNRPLPPDATWVRVLAGHSGAGASTVALAIADAAAAAGRRVRLIEAAHPARSGLVAASSAELGLDESGSWRRGTRGQPALIGQVVIVRRAGAAPPHAWPTEDSASAGTRIAKVGDVRVCLNAVDLGMVPVDALDLVITSGCRVVIACRQTVAGMRLVEQLLDQVGAVHAVVAMLGPRRWPGEVASSAGPLLRALRDDDRLVAVPFDRRLEVTGPTYAPLPKAVLAAGRALLDVLDALDSARPDAVAA